MLLHGGRTSSGPNNDLYRYCDLVKLERYAMDGETRIPKAPFCKQRIFVSRSLRKHWCLGFDCTMMEHIAVLPAYFVKYLYL